MDIDRRRLLAGGGAALAASLSGCLGVVTGDRALAFAADPVRVAPAALRATNYGEYRVYQDTITRTVGAFGVDRTVEVENWVAEYDQGVDLPLGRLQAAVFATLSTPQVRVLGQRFNPVAGMSTDEIVALVQSRYEAVENVSKETDLSATLLGEETTLSRYTADARLVDGGVTLSVYLYVAGAVTAGEDFVLALAVHPRFAGTRIDRVRRLLAGVEHGGGG